MILGSGPEELKIQKLTNPKNNEFDSKIKTLMGKNIDENQFKELISLNDNHLKQKILDQFKNNRDERIKILGIDQAKDIEKRILLQSIDVNWKSHIQYLEQLRQVIGLRSYGQRDPLVEYKKEAFHLFESLLNKLKIDFVTILINLKIVRQQEIAENSVKKKGIEISNNPKCLLLQKKGEKISRNEKCEATGKKFKNCCGAL